MGPFEYAQVTYEFLEAAKEGGDPTTLAIIGEGGLWYPPLIESKVDEKTQATYSRVTPDLNSQGWSDYAIYAQEKGETDGN